MIPATVSSVEDMVLQIRLDEIAPHPFNPDHRLSPDLPANQELAESIRQEAERRGEGRGVLQAITIHPVPPELDDLKTAYVIGFGHRRWACSRMAGETQIRAVVEQASAEDILARMIEENAQREPMPPIAEAQQLRYFIETVELTQAQAGKRLGKGQSWVNKRLSLLKLPSELQGQIDAGRLSVSSAYELAKLADYPVELKRVLKQVRDGERYKDELIVRDAVDEARTRLGIAGENGRGRKRSAVETVRQALRRRPHVYVKPEDRDWVRKGVRIRGPLYADAFRQLGMQLHPFLEEAVQRALEERLTE